MPLKIQNALAGTGARQSADAIAQKTVKCRVRVSPGGYLSVLFFLTFVAAFLAYFTLTALSLILLIGSWTVIPAIYYFDQIEFDGKSLTRKGLVAFIKRLLTSRSLRLKVSDVERVETQTLRTLRSGGKVFYRYRSEVLGEETSFVLVSGGKQYRLMIRQLFALIAEEKLDTRSLELRHFLVEPTEIEKKIAETKLPSADILENTLPKLRRLGLRRQERQSPISLDNSKETSHKKVAELGQVANELRVAGNLSQAMEAFRRALLWQPDNGFLLHDFARGLYSYASAARSATWMHRALAALRLAAKRSEGNPALLARIGESYFQFGSFERAAKTFQQALEADAANFRAECGLAEIALHDGKLAHVVHHYQAAVRVAPDAATRRRVQIEADYFALLNSNEDYLEAEVSRLGWSQSAARGKRICLRLTIVGLVLTLVGLVFESEFVAFGWALAAANLLVWAILSIAARFLSERFSLDEVGRE